MSSLNYFFFHLSYFLLQKYLFSIYYYQTQTYFTNCFPNKEEKIYNLIIRIIHEEKKKQRILDYIFSQMNYVYYLNNFFYVAK